STRYGAMVGPRLPKLNFLALATSITTTSSCNRSKSRLNARVTVDIDLLLTQLAHPTRHHEPSRPCRSLIARWFSCKDKGTASLPHSRRSIIR
ncbi:hypothetical protein JI435_071210, partial [Parastagonospora nodorum SN15]